MGQHRPTPRRWTRDSTVANETKEITVDPPYLAPLAEHLFHRPGDRQDSPLAVLAVKDDGKTPLQIRIRTGLIPKEEVGGHREVDVGTERTAYFFQ